MLTSRPRWSLGTVSAVLLAIGPTVSAASDGSASLASATDSSFQFDGTNSDLAQQFYRRFLDDDEADQLDVSDADLPSSVASRLSDAGVASFDALPGLAQRAVLWDSGFAIAPDGSLKQIYPLDSRPMADLAVPLDDFTTTAGCTPLECEQLDGETAYSNQFCTGDRMLTVARCVVEDYDAGQDAGLAMWATGGNASMIPEMRLMVHNWSDSDGSYLVFAVHTLPEAEEPAYGSCPSDGYGSVVVPCHPVSTYTGSSTLEAPQATAWVTEWLQQFQSSSGSGSATGTATDSSSGSFVFDGTNSDIARQLRNQYDKGVSVDNITLTAIPNRLASRLKDLGVVFGDLPGIVQRALLWDTGFALTPNGDAKEIWVLPDMIGDDDPNMANLAVSYQGFQDVGCDALNCSQPDGSKAFASQFCNGDQMLRAVKCVIDDFSDGGNNHLAMWANGGDTDSAVPEIRLVEHSWEDANTSYLVYAIHTLDEATEPTYGECREDKGYGSLVVPCYPLSSLTVAKNAGKVEPTQSKWVDDWVTEVMTANQEGGTDSGSGISMYVWIAIGGGALLLIVIGVCVGCFICRSRRKATRDKLGSPTDNNDGGQYGGAAGGAYDDGGYGPGNHYQPYNHLATPQFAGDVDTGRRTASTGDDNVSHRRVSAGSCASAALVASRPSYHVDDSDSGGSNNVVVRMLRDDPVLGSKRLPFESINFKRLLCKGAFGEVWVCDYVSAFGHPQEVAVKRLLQDRQHKFDEIQEFANEIQLSASLSHPNVVETIGVAWNTLDNLVLVMEYIAMGDLQNYLKKQGDLLSWARDKIHIAIGIARAIEYLHSIQPPLIHRDLKSKNVLLTRELFPKVIDFGVTRRRAEDTMTAGVGTPYWTAPEVLNGERYTEQSDIYSFGVLLAELDTCRLPYYDAVDAKGVKLKPFQVLKSVMGGVLRPSFSYDCPPRVRQLGVACLQQDARRRPSARELVGILGG